MDDKDTRAYRKIYEWARDAERPGGGLDWYSVDRIGNVAAFCTAGFGPVPDAIVEAGRDAFLKLMEFMEELDDVPLHAGGFEPITKRGMAVFDFEPDGVHHVMKWSS